MGQSHSLFIGELTKFENIIEKELIEVESNLQGIFNAAHNGDAESYEILLKIKEAIGSI